MFSFFFVNLKMITVFTLLDVFCFFIYIYIYNFTSCHVQFMVCTPEASAIASENEHWTWTGGTSPCRGERRAAVKAAVFVFFCFAPFFFFLSVLFWTDMDLMLAREKNQRCLFGLVFFFPPPFVISFLYFHDLSRGSLIILLMKICSGQNIFVVIKQWTS